MEITKIKDDSFRIKGKEAIAEIDLATGSLKIEDFTISGPGEYEVRGVIALGIAVPQKVYCLTVDNVRICALTLITDKFTNDQAESLGDVDILLLDTRNSPEIVAQLTPRIVIPAGETEKFLRDMGKEGIALQPKLSITKDKLPEELQVVLLK